MTKCSFAVHILLAYVVMFKIIHVQAPAAGKSLVQYLFDESRYDKRVVPSRGFDGTINITLGLTVYEFRDLVEKEQTLVTYGLFHQSWNDPKLTWNPVDFDGQESITVKATNIWYPDIVSYNSEVTNYRLETGILDYSGNIQFSYPMKLRSFCKFDVATYPFDKHRCELVFGSWGYTGDLLMVEASDNPIDLNRYVDNVAWVLESSNSKQNKLYYGASSLPYYDVTFIVSFKRRVLYDSVYLILPGVIAALFGSTVFMLPINCSERITTGMAVLVLLSFFFLVVMEKLPATSAISLVSMYYTATLCEMTVSFFLNVIVLRFYHMTEDQVPPWVKKYLLNYGASLLRMKFVNSEIDEDEKGRHTTKKEVKQRATRNGSGSRVTLEAFVADKVVYSKIMHERRAKARDNEWKKAAEVLGYYCLILHLVFVFTLFAGLFVHRYNVS